MSTHTSRSGERSSRTRAYAWSAHCWRWRVEQTRLVLLSVIAEIERAAGLLGKPTDCGAGALLTCSVAQCVVSVQQDSSTACNIDHLLRVAQLVALPILAPRYTSACAVCGTSEQVGVRHTTEAPVKPSGDAVPGLCRSYAHASRNRIVW